MKYKIKIPKIIHQIYIGEKQMPDQQLIWQETWKDYNQDWEFIFWDDAKLKNVDLINKDAC